MKIAAIGYGKMGRMIEQIAPQSGGEIGFDSPADTITLRQVARDREGFARGARRAAPWVIGKRGLFEFGDIVFS